MTLPYSNLQLEHWNPGATMPLTLPIHVICNTSDEQLFENIKINSARPGKWLTGTTAHEGVAILCGSGPSLSDSLDQIKNLANDGGQIFAMNGAARYIYDSGIIPDYQVILDAREETADLVGPALHHLFASQVHPKCFETIQKATLWHLQVDNIDDYLPEYDDPYCLIGGSASVGNTAACLAYAMGFRKMKIFGYDSSHRGTESHAFHQKMNDGDPCASVRFNGKDYIVSLTMKLQAERFQETARNLKQLGCTIEVYGDGLLPDMYNQPVEVMSEVEKYNRLWATNEYRDTSPGESLVDRFFDIMVFGKGDKLIDFGCGTGRAGVKLAASGLDVTLVDFTNNSRDVEALVLPFIKHDLTLPLPVNAHYGFCTDVMEHIPTKDVDAVINNIMNCASKTFFQISTIPDNMGTIIGQDLHLTVKPFEWWKDKFERLGYIVSWAEKQNIAALFSITNYGIKK